LHAQDARATFKNISRLDSLLYVFSRGQEFSQVQRLDCDPFRLRRPPICIRQLASLETIARTPAFSMASILLSSIATDISGYFTEKVPPKPQQASALASQQTQPAHLLYQPSRLAMHFKSRKP
jgi:hypothetical protein